MDKHTSVIILSVNGVLCFEQYYQSTLPCLDLLKIKRRPGILEFFRILLQHFHIGMWSSMQPGRLKKVLEYLLPKKVRTKLLFLYKCQKCRWAQYYPNCYKCVDRLFMDPKTRKFCMPDRVLMLDDQPRRNAYNGDIMCYFSKSWHGEMNLPNKRNVIPNISIALLPYILPFQNYNSVRAFLKEHEMDGKFRQRFHQRTSTTRQIILCILRECTRLTNWLLCTSFSSIIVKYAS